jgi:hypothetical protein
VAGVGSGSPARRSTDSLLWRLAGGVVIVSWLLGYAWWGRPPAPGFDSFNDWTFPVFVLAVGTPPFLLAAALHRGRSRLFRLLGPVATVTAVLIVSLLVQLSHFGGFCLDPGEDVCVVAWPSRILGLLAGLGAVLAGWLVLQRAVRRE